MVRLARALAVSSLLAVAAAAQERAPEAFQLGLGLQQRGMHEEAARKFEEFLREMPRSPLAAEASYRRGVSLLATGAAPAGIEALRRALELGGRGFALAPECRYRLATALQDGHDLEHAVPELDRLLQALPAGHYLQAPARYAQAECRRDLHDDEHALPGFLAAAAAATGESASYRFPALYQAGFAALRLGKAGAAQEHFTAAVAAAPDDAGKRECLYLAGDAALRAGDHAAAERFLDEALAGGGEFADDAALALGFLGVAAGDPKAALAAFRRVADEFGSSPLVPRAQLEIGRLLYQQHDYRAAEKVLAPLQRLEDPQLQKPAQELLGLCALAGGRGDAAIAPLRTALQAAPPAEQPRLSFALAEALADTGKWDEALAAYEAATKSSDAALRGDALYGACFALHRLGRYEDSVARAATLRQELPQHRLVPQAVFASGENLFALQRYEAAAREYAAVPAAAAPAADAAFKLAWCRYLLGAHKDAGQAFRAIAAQKDQPHAEEALSMAALALLAAGDGEGALRAADDYRARYEKGQFLDRTERVAARVLRQRGDLAGAARRLERAARSGKGGAGATDLLEEADLHYQRGDFRAAAAVYLPLADQRDAAGARALEGLAWCAFELGDDAECARRLQQGLDHEQGSGVRPGLLELRSALHHRQKDWAAAIADARAFLAEFPQHAKASAMRYALGVAQARAGDDKAARQTLAALAGDGGYERMDRVQYELAWACRRDGDEAAAQRAFAAVVATSKDQDLTGEARLHLGVHALQHGDVDAAAPLLLAVQGRHRARALYELAFADLEAATKAGSATPGPRLERARQLFTEVAAMADEPLGPEATFMLGECCRRGDDARGAAAQFRALLQKAPQHERAPMARLLLAEAAVQLGDGTEAVEQSERFLATNPKERADQARAQLALGRGRMLRGEQEAAQAAFAKVTELSDGPLAAEAQFCIGESRRAAGDLQGAVDAYVKLPILYAHAEWVRRGLLQAGLAYAQLQQADKAERLFAELVQRFPDSPEAATAKSRLDPK